MTRKTRCFLSADRQTHTDTRTVFAADRKQFCKCNEFRRSTSYAGSTQAHAYTHKHTDPLQPNKEKSSCRQNPAWCPNTSWQQMKCKMWRQRRCIRANQRFIYFALNQCRSPGRISLLGAEGQDLPAADEPEKNSGSTKPRATGRWRVFIGGDGIPRIERSQLEVASRKQQQQHNCHWFGQTLLIGVIRFAP